MSDIQDISKEYKTIRNKNSYMETFLERRKQAADFALKGKNKSGYKYTKPNIYIYDVKEKEINKYQKKNVFETTSNDKDNKNKYFKTYSSYSTLKKNYKRNNKLINMIFIEEEKNKYYLSDGIHNSYKNSKYVKMNDQLNPYFNQKNDSINNKNIYKYNYFEKSNEEYQELIDGLLTEEEINQQFNNINHHSITFSSKDRNYKNKENINENIASSPKEIFSEMNKNELWNNHKDKQSEKNNYDCNNKKKYVTSSNIKPDFEKNNKYGLLSNYTDINITNRYKQKSSTRVKGHLNLNLINSGKENEVNKTNIDEDNNNIYYEGFDNRKFYNSKRTNGFKYSCEPYKSKNKAQNKNEKLISRSNIEKDKKKKLYKIKTDNDINKRSKIEKSQINDISPIRTLCRHNYEDYNDFRNIEKIIESKSIIGNSDTNSNIKLKNNVKKPSSFSNDKKNLNSINYNINEFTTRSLDRLKQYSTKVLKDTGNTKAINILCKSQEIPKVNIEENYIKIIQKSNKINENINKTNNDKNINDSFLNDKNIPNKNICNCKKINYSVNNNSGNYLLKEEETKMKTNQSPQNIEKITDNVNTNDFLYNFHQISNKIMNNDKNDNNYLKIIKYNHINNQINKDIENDNNKENQDINNIIRNNIKIESKMQNYNNNDFEEYSNIDEEEQNNEIIKDRYESFLKQKDEKEPNLQSKVFNSLLTSKDDSYLMNSNNNLIKNIQDTIKILKNNISKDKNNDLNKNYINEIDIYFNKIKQKEEKNNSTLNEYYLGLSTKNNKKNIQEKENNKIIDKKVMIQRSLRLQNMMDENSDYQQYKLNRRKNYNTNTNIKYDKFSPSQTYNPKQLKKSIHLKEIGIKNNFNYIKLSKYKNNPVPSINLIVDETNYENTKIMDENEYFKLKKKNIKSTRPNLTIKTLKSDNIYSYRNGFDLYRCNNHVNKRSTYKFGSKMNAYSSRIILSDINNKIMPPNEI